MDQIEQLQLPSLELPRSVQTIRPNSGPTNLWASSEKHKVTKGQKNGLYSGVIWLLITRNSSGDEIANVDLFYDDILNHFYAVCPGSYRIP